MQSTEKCPETRVAVSISESAKDLQDVLNRPPEDTAVHFLIKKDVLALYIKAKIFIWQHPGDPLSAELDRAFNNILSKTKSLMHSDNVSNGAINKYLKYAENYTDKLGHSIIQHGKEEFVRMLEHYCIYVLRKPSEYGALLHRAVNRSNSGDDSMLINVWNVVNRDYASSIGIKVRPLAHDHEVDIALPIHAVIRSKGASEEAAQKASIYLSHREIIWCASSREFNILAGLATDRALVEKFNYLKSSLEAERGDFENTDAEQYDREWMQLYKVMIDIYASNEKSGRLLLPPPPVPAISVQSKQGSATWRNAFGIRRTTTQ